MTRCLWQVPEYQTDTIEAQRCWLLPTRLLDQTQSFPCNELGDVFDLLARSLPDATWSHVQCERRW